MPRSRMTPSRNGTARPAIVTTSPRSSQNSSPRRAESWCETSEVLPSRFAQNGTMMRCAVPQTGSSGRPSFGAKTRMTKSERLAAAVTMTAFASSAAIRWRSGASSRTSSSEAKDRDHPEVRFERAFGPAPEALLQRIEPIHVRERHDRPVDRDQVAFGAHAPRTAVLEPQGELARAGAKMVERHPGRRMRRVAGARVRAGRRGEAELDLGAVRNQHGDHVLMKLRAQLGLSTESGSGRSSVTTKAGLPRNGSLA